MHPTFNEFVAGFLRWAEVQEDLRAALIIGSQAREDAPADRWSDLDLVLVTTEPQRYLDETAWLGALGVPILTFLEPQATGGGVERRALFRGGLDVDFTPASVARVQGLVAQGLTPETAAVFSRGVRVLLDKDGLMAHLNLHDVPHPPAPPPSAEAFEALCHDFLYHALWTAKKLRRGELWTAKFCLDGYLKGRCLLPLLEWHAKATRGWDTDTWHGGRFLETWADPRAVAGLGDAFARYDEADMWRALFVTLELFRWLGEETA